MPDEPDWKEIEAPISEKDIEESLKQIQNWQLSGNAIEKSFNFETFRQAIDFINEVARIATAENHHPSILLSNVTHVKITITTLCIRGLSKLDFILASKIDKLTSASKPY